jgi:formate/nitrite transporter FocA (FNT family)
MRVSIIWMLALFILIDGQHELLNDFVVPLLVIVVVEGRPQSVQFIVQTAA